MVWSKSTDAPQLLKQGTINQQGLAITLTTMHEAMADRADGAGAGVFLQQLDQRRNAGNVIGRINHALAAPVREEVRER